MQCSASSRVVEGDGGADRHRSVDVLFVKKRDQVAAEQGRIAGGCCFGCFFFQVKQGCPKCMIFIIQSLDV